MTAEIAAYGRLGRDPRQVETRSGKTMTVASIAVQLGAEPDGATWLGIVAFGTTAETLVQHRKGEPVSVTGRLQSRTWTDGDRATRQQFEVVADSILSARTVRPGARAKARDRRAQPPDAIPSDDGMPDDEIPF